MPENPISEVLLHGNPDLPRDVIHEEAALARQTAAMVDRLQAEAAELRRLVETVARNQLAIAEANRFALDQIADGLCRFMTRVNDTVGFAAPMGVVQNPDFSLNFYEIPPGGEPLGHVSMG